MSSITTLRSAVKAAQSNKNNSGTSEKNPAWYNRQKNRFVAAMVTNESAVVRAAAASDEHCPTKQLQAALRIEQDATVLKAILMNPNLPEKDILLFVDDPRVELLDKDAELTAYLSDRIKA